MMKVRNFLKNLDVNFAAVICRYREIYFGIMQGQQVGYHFGPFNKADIATVKILLATHIKGLGLAF